MPLPCSTYFSSKSLVCPEISGLVPAGFKPPYNDVRIYGRPRNVESLSVLESRGIRYVVGDNSRYTGQGKGAYADICYGEMFAKR